MTVRTDLRHEYVTAALWVLGALFQAVTVSIMFLRTEPITGWVTLRSLFILVGMCWSLHKAPRS